MALAYKILGQSAPADTNNADMYTVPTATETVISTVAITNTSGTLALARIFVRENAAAAAASNAIAYDINVPANDTLALTLGITLNAADVISVRSSVSNSLTFHAFGTEIS